MSYYLKNSAACIIFFFCAAFSALGGETGGIDINYDVIRSAGMGNTGAGFSLGAGSVFLNPGALPMQYKNQFAISATSNLSYTAYQNRTPSLYKTVSNPQWTTPFGVYGSFRLNKYSRWALGISVNSPFSIKTSWKNDWKGRAIVNNYVFNTIIIQPAVSYRISEKVGVGVGLMYCRAGLWTDRVIPDIIPSNGETNMRIYGNGQGWGLNTGVYVRWNERVSAGVNLRTPVMLHLKKGKVSVDALNDSKTTPFTTFSTELPLPYIATAGIGIRSLRQLLIAAEVSYTGWNLWDSTVIRYDSLAEQLPEYARHVNLRNTLSFKSGVEWNSNEHFTFRFGGYYILSPVRNGFVSPEYPDANRIGLTAGVGITPAENFHIEMSGKYEMTGERTFTFTQEGFSGIYKMNTYGAGISMAYDF